MADSRHTLVLDAGTSAMRCYVFDDNGRIVATTAQNWSYVVEKDAPTLARALDPDDVWRTYCDLIKAALHKARIEARTIDSIAVTSQRQGVVFLDRIGREIYAGPNIDLRAVFEGGAIDDDLRGEVYQVTGHLPSFFFTPAKLRWFQEHRPDAYDKISCVLTLADWLVWKLTATMVSEHTLAAEAGLLDVRSRIWAHSLFQSIGVISNSIGLLQAGKFTGLVTREASVCAGLRENTPVATAGADTQCGLLGMGVARENQVGVVAGWSAPLQMVTPHPIFSPDMKTWIGCHLDAGQWVLESSPGDIGNAYRWLADTLFSGEDQPFERMNAVAGETPVGSEGAMAYLGHSRMDMTNLGMKIGGFMFPVPLTFSDMGRGHIVRSVLESTAYAIRTNLEQLEQEAGVQATEVMIGGGMTRTPLFSRILADVLGRDIAVSPVPEVSAKGAFLCARVALGEFATIAAAAESVRPELQVLVPDSLDSLEYQDYYEQWLELEQRLGGLEV